MSLHTNHRVNEQGFSLVQLAVILTVFAIAAAALIPGGERGAPLKRMGITMDKLQTIEDAIVGYKARFGKLPCPADLGLPMNDNNFGMEADNPGACVGGAVQATYSNAGPVVGGAVPIVSLGLSDEYIMDGNGRRFTYYVDAMATSGASCKTMVSGSLNIRSTSGGAVLSNAMMAIVAHGENGHGAYPANPPAGFAMGSRLDAGVTDDDEEENASFQDDTTNLELDADLVSKDPAGDFDDTVRYHTNCCVGAACEDPPYDGPELFVHGSSLLRHYEKTINTDNFVKQADVATLPAAGAGLAVSPDNEHIATASNQNPALYIYKRTGLTLTKLADLNITGDQGTGTYTLDYSPNGLYLAALKNLMGTPRLFVFERTGDNYTKIADMADQPTGDSHHSLAFSPSGDYLAVSFNNGNRLNIYSIDYNTDTFTLLTGADGPQTMPGCHGHISWTHDSNYLAVGCETTIVGGLKLYKRSADAFTLQPDPVFQPADAVRGADFSHDSTYLALVADDPKLILYKRDSGNPDLWAQIPNPAVMPTGTPTSVRFSHDSTYLMITQHTPHTWFLYKREGDLFTDITSNVDTIDAAQSLVARWRN